MKPSLNIGFIGLGDQGGPMARAIGESGLKLHVWARRTRSLEAVAGVPHTVHASIKALAEACDIIGLCLRDDRDLWDILDRQGLLKALEPGTIVINHGTGDPDENRRIASYLDEVHVTFLDAPVSGGRPGAVARALTTFVGGDAAAFEQCQPVFGTFSTQAVHMGRSGSGQVAKLLNNALTMTNLKNAVDVFGFADKLGLNISSLFDAVSASSGSSAVLRALGTAITPGIAPHLQELMRKDIEHFADAMSSRGLDASEVVERGLGGANGLLDLVQRVTASRPNA
ncbi:NAD(P)-dependent oxidoreductase [Microvirga sp. Mcv34]|uniref:NAD(P)-dependent oxidoreductase n=1 Tax=Microvirga sp. Mcv34 TaxID=2926016 RepID=UPI0021CA950E|nr:NAD(P)-dependent oxidoreductase [Microvirga sp. Mcv34]